MQKLDRSRKARFKAALASAGLTQTEWASMNGITAGHLGNTLRGRESKVLEEKIDAFIDQVETKVRSAA
jgi:hypothetical protein